MQRGETKGGLGARAEVSERTADRVQRGETKGGLGAVAMRGTVTIYGRRGCHLCEVAKQVIEAMLADLPGFEVLEIDITERDALHAAYLERIPVVALNGVELFEHFVDEQRLREALEAAGPA